jgi:hypothetical protein
VTVKGPKGEASVYQGDGHDWMVDFYPKWYNRRPPPKVTRRTFKGPGAKGAAVIVAKQLTGVFDK